MTNQTLIECDKLSKRYRDFYALKDLSFRLDQPSIVGLIGKNGAGKTTLLRILSGLYHPSEGSAKILGSESYDSELRAINAILIDDTMTFPKFMKLKDILREFSAYYPNWDNERALKLIEYFKLPLDRAHHKLSKGMKSTFNAILGLAANCAITLMDEPTTGMDANARVAFYEIILNEFMAFPRLIIVSSHMIQELENLISDVILIKHGVLVMHEPAESLIEKSWILYGDADAVAAVSNGKTVFKSEKILNKTQCMLYGALSADDLKFLADNETEYSHMTLNDVGIYLSEDDNRQKLSDIYADTAASENRS